MRYFALSFWMFGLYGVVVIHPRHSMSQLSETEIRQRLQRLRNLEKRNESLEAEVQRLRQECLDLQDHKVALESENDILQKELETARLQYEELKALKFGRRRAKEILALATPAKEGVPELARAERPAESYRRQVPSATEITDHLRLGLSVCPDCGSTLHDRKEHIHYREDLRDIEELLRTAKQIVETTIESGACSLCRTRQFAAEVPKQSVVVGPNLRTMVAYMAICQGQSYSEMKRSLKHQYDITVSGGELTNILEGESVLLTPYYNQLIKELEQESRTTGCHYDETSWDTGDQGMEVSEGNYAWTKVGVASDKQLLWFGRSRGKGVAENLRGVRDGSIGVSDDYGGYRQLFDQHQLCWAHPLRKLRDLAGSEALSGETKLVCEQAYAAFAAVYAQAEHVRHKLQANTWSAAEKSTATQALTQQFAELYPETSHDPVKLKAIRQSLRERAEKYFTFLDLPQLPLDNNKAERALRKIVLKRKKSFGSKSQKGANVLSILYSVIFSLLATNPEKSFFELYREAVEIEAPE